MDPLNFFNTLELQDDLILDQEIDPLSTIKVKPLVVDWQRMFQRKLNAVQFQLMCQALLVGGFQKARSKQAMNLDGTTDHFIGKLAEFPLHALHVLHGQFI